MSKVSVILTSFNHEKYIQEAINSVLNQTYQDFELIIWDDASFDNSWYLINQYSDARIKVFRNDIQRRGLWGINKAISEVASGEYIAIHHSDDVWEPEKLEKQVAFLDTHDEIGAVFTNALAITEDGQTLTDEKHFYFNIFDQPNRSRHEWLRYFFSHGNALCHPSVLIRKKCYDECGPYRFGLAQVGDFDMWIRLCLKYEIHVLPENLVRFRIRDDEANTSGNRPETRIRGVYEFYKLLSNYRNLACFDDLVKIFPSAKKYYRNEETDLDFVLAMVALEKKSFSFTGLFGLELLFEAISDPRRSASIKRLYDFDYTSFIALTAQHDVFSLENVSNLWIAITERDGQIANLNQAVADRDKQIANLNQAVADRDKQIANLNQAVADRDTQLINFNQALADLDARIVNFIQALNERNGHIINLIQALNDCDVQIRELKNNAGKQDERIRALESSTAELERILSSRSWKMTKPLRFTGRILRGDWAAVRASILSLRKAKRNALVIEEKTSANKDVFLKDEADTSWNKQYGSLEQSPFSGKRILLVSYYCPSRAHAGGLRILDIYSLIKSAFPKVQMDLYAHKRPVVDWSYEDVEKLFDNIFWSPVEDLSLSGFNMLSKTARQYDVVDIQYHQSKQDIDSWRNVGQKIVFTPMESFLRVLLMKLESHDKLTLQNMDFILAREELMFAKKADEVVCVSEKDASSLRMFYPAGKIYTLETAVSNIEFVDAFDHRHEDINPELKEPIILYIAFFGSETNIEALKWYLINVHPLINSALPEYRLQVIGRGDLSIFKNYQSHSVELIGEVPKLTPYIRRAKVGIAPALSGSGIRGKINQYSIYGVPVVASRIAAESLVYQDGLDIFMTDQERLFAQYCIRLLQENDLNRAMGQRAREKVYTQYTWESKIDAIKKIYDLGVA